jgi:hypothetical protein
MLTHLRDHIPVRLEICLWTAFGLACLLALAGCSTSPVELVGDTDEAQSLLSTALDAWKAGQKPDDLRSEQPAVYVADEDWRAGTALKAYQVTGIPLEAGGHWRVSARLTLSAGGHSDLQKNVAYAVTMEPAITILRADDVPE